MINTHMYIFCMFYYHAYKFQHVPHDVAELHDWAASYNLLRFTIVHIIIYR